MVNEPLIAFPTSAANHFFSTAHAAGEGSAYLYTARLKRPRACNGGEDSGDRCLSRRV